MIGACKAAGKVRPGTSWLVVGCLVLAVSAPVFAEAPGAESPEALVERMKRAGETEDFGEMMACLAPEGRIKMASMMYLMATMMVGFSMMGAEMGSGMGEAMAEGMGEELTDEQKADMEAQKKKALAQVAEIRESYNAMVAKYGLPELTEEGEAPDTDLEAVFRDIDHAAFFKDVMAFLDSMPGDEEEETSPAEEGAPWDFGDATLTDLKIEGDTATGKVGDEEVTFVRIDGRWYFDADFVEGAGGP
jgi:hypothetical protein